MHILNKHLRNIIAKFLAQRVDEQSKTTEFFRNVWKSKKGKKMELLTKFAKNTLFAYLQLAQMLRFLACNRPRLAVTVRYRTCERSMPFAETQSIERFFSKHMHTHITSLRYNIPGSLRSPNGDRV